MTTSAKLRWAILALALFIALGCLAFMETTGRFYCAVSIILGIILYYLAESYLDNLLYGSKVASALKEGRDILKETQALRKRAKGHLPSEIEEQLNETQEQLKTALLKREVEAIHKGQNILNTLVEKHLSLYRKVAWREFFDPIAVAVLLALLLRSFVVEAFEIPSGSMIPNLLVGDKIFVNKLVYNIRVPFFNTQVAHLGNPERGDVAVFVYPMDPSENFVKRVVALPGDTVEVISDIVYVNGKALPRRNLGPATYWDLRLHHEWYENNYHQFNERNGDVTYTVLQDPHRIRQDYGKRTIPDGYIFVMGDNRDNSSDSREWGLVPLDNLVGKAMFIWWSKGPYLHKERFFTWVD